MSSVIYNFSFGDVLAYQSPINPEQLTDCVFIRNDGAGKAVVCFQNAEFVARVPYHRLFSYPVNITKNRSLSIWDIDTDAVLQNSM